MFQGCSVNDSMFKKSSRCYKKVSRVFQGNFKGINRDILKVFQGSVKKIFEVFLTSLCCMALIAATRAVV